MARTPPAATFVLDHTPSGKDTMKSFEIFPNGGANFFDVIHLSIGKAVMNASRIWQLRKDSLTGIG
jgi:hypothetical protein